MNKENTFKIIDKDSIAAQIILQDYLNKEKNNG